MSLYPDTKQSPLHPPYGPTDAHPPSRIDNLERNLTETQMRFTEENEALRDIITRIAGHLGFSL